MKPPETWNDEETLDADLRLWLHSESVEYSEDVLQAFRIGWKAGARQATINMGKWIHRVVFGHEEPERKEPNEENE